MLRKPGVGVRLSRDGQPRRTRSILDEQRLRRAYRAGLEPLFLYPESESWACGNGPGWKCDRGRRLRCRSNCAGLRTSADCGQAGACAKSFRRETVAECLRMFEWIPLARGEA